MDTIDAIERAWEQGTPVVAALTEAQLDAPTPCGNWDVRELLTHQLVETGMFTRVNLGLAPESPDDESIDWARLAGEWTSIGGDNLASWRKAGLEGERTYPFGTFPAEVAAVINLGEIVVHSWDIAHASGQTFTPDPALVSIVYGLYGNMDMTPYRTYDVFGPEIPVATDAPELDRLLGLLGRQP